MGLLVLSLFTMLAALMSGIGAQSLPSCDYLFEELTGEGFCVFVNVLNLGSFSSMRQRDCVNDQFQVERYYHCPEGSVAFIPRFDTADTINDLSQVIDLDVLRDQLNETGALLLCVPRQQLQPATTTISPPPPPPSPTPPSVGRCPRGPTMVRNYLRQDQPRLCQRTCSFRTAVDGISTGIRTRTIFICCPGEEPVLFSRASRLYSCRPN